MIMGYCVEQYLKGRINMEENHFNTHLEGL